MRICTIEGGVTGEQLFVAIHTPHLQAELSREIVDVVFFKFIASISNLCSYLKALVQKSCPI